MKRYLHVVALLGLVAVVGSCLLTYRLVVEDPERTWDASELTVLQLKTRNGSVELEADFGSTVRLTATRVCYGRNKADAEEYIDRVKVVDTVVGGRLEVEAEMPATTGRNYGAAFDGLVPTDLILDLHTSNGKVGISGLKAAVEARTSNGALTLTGTEGQADLRTSNGALTLQVHRGGVDGETSNGAVSADIAELAPSDAVALETSNGGIDLYLPEDVSASFDASTSNGTVSVAGFDNIVYEVDQPAHKKGTIGSGASEIELETSNGSIEIRAR